MHKGLWVSLIVGVSMQAAHADEWMVEAHYPDRAALARAAAHFQHVIVDRKRNVLRVDTDDAGIAALQGDGLTVTIDTAASARLQALQSSVHDAAMRGYGIDSIPGFECYRTVEETYATMDTLASAHPDIVAIDDIGPTWKHAQDPGQGYEMRALHITNFSTLAGDPDRTAMVVFSSIHAREYAPAEVDTRFAEWLVNGYGTDPEATWLVDHNDFHLILQANPDGRKEAEQQIYWRKNVDEINGNCDGDPNVDTDGDGIDLNRNFPFHWNITNGGGSSGFVCDETYRGPTKASEPETQNLMQYVAGTCADDGTCTGGIFADRRAGPMNPPNVGGDGGDAAPDDTTGFFVDIHSYASLILWPWGDTSSAAPNQSGLRRLGRRIGWFNGYRPQQSDELYPTDGTTDDTLYGLLGVPAYTIETDSAFFEDCSTFESFTAPANLRALRYAARTLHAPYLLPNGPDTIDVGVGSDLVVAGDPLTVTASLDGSRYNQSNGTEPVYDIAGASAYIDDLPWQSATPAPLDAADGAFDSPVETALGTVATTGLAPGRHFVYVQASDSAGNDGTPNAAFVDIVDAGSVGTLSGVITDQGTKQPLSANVTLHNPNNDETRHAISDPTTGDYVAHAYPGSFDVRVSAPYHLAETLSGVTLDAGVSVAHDFSLLPDCTILFDDVENGGSAWTAQSPWVISNGVTGNTTHVWNTPNYGDGINRSLTTATAYDLTGYSDVTLDFDDRCDTESGYDYGYVEFSADNGNSWTGVYSCTGQTSWQSHHLELPAGANDTASFMLRFRLQSDAGLNAPGWSVDNIRIGAGGDACRAQQANDEIFANGFEP